MSSNEYELALLDGMQRACNHEHCAMAQCGRGGACFCVLSLFVAFPHIIPAYQLRWYQHRCEDHEERSYISV